LKADVSIRHSRYQLVANGRERGIWSWACYKTPFIIGSDLELTPQVSISTSWDNGEKTKQLNGPKDSEFGNVGGFNLLVMST